MFHCYVGLPECSCLSKEIFHIFHFMGERVITGRPTMINAVPPVPQEKTGWQVLCQVPFNRPWVLNEKTLMAGTNKNMELLCTYDVPSLLELICKFYMRNPSIPQPPTVTPHRQTPWPPWAGAKNRAHASARTRERSPRLSSPCNGSGNDSRKSPSSGRG